MQSLADFYKPLDPYTKQPVWALKEFPESGAPFSIRPVYIPDDLVVLYRWVHARDGGVNGIHLDRPRSLIRHYTKMAHSSRGQSFAILQMEKMICQVDVRGAEMDPLYFLLNTSVADCILKCLIPEASLENGRWKMGLNLLFGLFLRVPDGGNIFVESPEYPLKFSAGLSDLGFESVQSPPGANSNLILFRKEND